MKRHQAKRVEIVVEAPMQQRLTDALLAAGVTGFTLLPVSGGAGRSGAWTREGQVSKAGGMTMIICIVREDKLDTLLDAAFPILERHIGVVSITDCDVLRAERF